MAAMYSVEQEPVDRHPLARGASPEAIREALLPEDRVRFDSAFDAALDELRRHRDLTVLFDMLEHWRRIAIVQSDRGRFTALARRVAEQVTGEASPADEPLAVTREKAGI
ncbi:DUF6247 family protein [Actinomycetospora flava]|uniref:DUF6247 family protein n=1 Tax=Actinomycetospora flava TaxID=3129232 RepID=A0ABU8LZT7_9PSEU